MNFRSTDERVICHGTSLCCRMHQQIATLAGIPEPRLADYRVRIVRTIETLRNGDHRPTLPELGDLFFTPDLPGLISVDSITPSPDGTCVAFKPFPANQSDGIAFAVRTALCNTDHVQIHLLAINATRTETHQHTRWN